MLLLRGLPNVLTSVGIETLVGATRWFTQSLRVSSFKPIAFGQVGQHHQRAKINWMLPLDESQPSSLLSLIDNLAIEAGLHGAKYILASCAKEHPLYILFRQCGYAPCGWERFWSIKPSRKMDKPLKENHWQRATSLDTIAIMEFQRKNLPPAIRSITPLANEVLPDFVLKYRGQVYGFAFIELFGNKGIIHPTIAPHPEIGQDLFEGLFFLLPDSISSLYIVQTTSNNGWGDIFDQIAEPVSARQELLVKYFAIREKSPVGLLNHASENGHPDPVAPFIHSGKTQDNL